MAMVSGPNSHSNSHHPGGGDNEEKRSISGAVAWKDGEDPRRCIECRMGENAKEQTTSCIIVDPGEDDGCGKNSAEPGPEGHAALSTKIL